MTSTLYKIYTEVLAGRIKEKVKMVLENQAGIRKGREAMDNIYVINYIVGKNLSRKGEKVIAYFVDFKAAFDLIEMMIDRKKLLEAIRERRMREDLLRRCGDLYRKTKNRVRVEGTMGKEF